MRNLLDEANKQHEAAPQVAAADARRLPKRFYSEAGVAVVEGGFAVTLDARPTKTPAGNPVVVPVAPLATAMVAEWAAQEESIDPETMPIVRLVGSALDAGDERAAALREEIISYCGNDLLLYRADTPRELVAEQEQHWDGALVRLARHFGVAFRPTVGIIHQPQPEPTLASLAESLADESLLNLAALLAITVITGSGLLALALQHRLLTPDAAWTAANVDEDHNIRLWGAVDQAVQRREQRRREFDAAVAVLDTLRP